MNNTARIVDIKRFAIHDGPGIRTTVFLKGCPLRCLWCHNPEGISTAPELAYYAHKCAGCGMCVKSCPRGAHSFPDNAENGAPIHIFDRSLCIACGKCAENCVGEALTLFGREISAGEALKTVLEDRIFYASSGGGVTLSGGEPLLHPDFCAELLSGARAEGIGTAVDTCGDVPEEAFRAVLPYTDLFLYDLKHMDAVEHKKLTGRSNERILANLRLLSELGRPAEIRIPLIPTLNDSAENLTAAGAFLAKLPNITRVKVLPYHDMARSKYAALGKPDTMPKVAPPDDDALDRAAAILTGFGLNAVSGRKA